MTPADVNPQPFFLARMNRLKTALGVSKDKEVAAALGLSDKALNARKARNSFPEKEVIDLAEARPDLRLNLDFILDGTPPVQETQEEFIGRRSGIKTIAALMMGMPPQAAERPEAPDTPALNLTKPLRNQFERMQALRNLSADLRLSARSAGTRRRKLMGQGVYVPVRIPRQPRLTPALAAMRSRLNAAQARQRKTAPPGRAP